MIRIAKVIRGKSGSFCVASYDERGEQVGQADTPTLADALKEITRVFGGKKTPSRKKQSED